MTATGSGFRNFNVQIWYRKTPERPIDVITVQESPKPKVLATKLKQKHPAPRLSPKAKIPTKKGPPTKKRKPTTPEQSPASAKDSDLPYEPDSCLSSDDSRQEKKGKTTPAGSATKKRTTLGKRPDLAWCSSESELDSNGKKGTCHLHKRGALHTVRHHRVKAVSILFLFLSRN